MSVDAERQRLADAEAGVARWRWWGPYLSSRQWGTVREDYSADGTAWDSFPHDHARSRAYRWGEDGLGGICDRWQHLCFAIALWNERDPILKERLFGLSNSEGNHGEDVKELWWPLDATPTSSWLSWLYKYPQSAFPYADLVAENRARGVDRPEYELVDTGAFADGRYFDVELTYAKASPDDICIVIDVTNRGPDPAPIHVLPHLWFRNTWAWGRDDRKPSVRVDDGTLHAAHTLGDYWLAAEGLGAADVLVCENETNGALLWGGANAPYPKDGIADHVLTGAATVAPDQVGTKSAFWAHRTLDAGERWTMRLRLVAGAPDDPFGPTFAATLAERAKEADAFYAALGAHATPEEREVQRRAIAGLLWSQKMYRYHVSEWLDGDPASPPPPAQRRGPGGRNVHWRSLYNADVISMPDEWEYPWYAAWDLAFHMIPLTLVDPEAAKAQLLLFTREWFMHPNGQLPAYEWAFDDVNPPVHAWAALRVFEHDAAATGVADHEFLERIFHKLLINFSWWVNRKDVRGDNLFEGGFLGLDNIGLFDRSRPLPSGQVLEQSDATSWMAMYCLNMLAIAAELAHHDRVYEDVCTKFFEHYLTIASAAVARGGQSLWDDEDGFFYDVLVDQEGRRTPLKVRSWVGLIPIFATECFAGSTVAALPEFRARAEWFVRHRPDQAGALHISEFGGDQERHLLAIVGPHRLRRILARVLDEDEFLSPHGIRSVSKAHQAAPVMLDLDGETHEVCYEPGDSTTVMFGGNSNWRGPVWFPLNYLMIESLERYHRHLGDSFTVDLPTGSGNLVTLDVVAAELGRRLTSLFVPDASGRRPSNGGDDLFDLDPGFRDHPTFSEYFHGDTGAGLGASHQTGWTALVAKLVEDRR
jgi:hypothetical protein